ncbi:MAG: RIP metalloprotease RseP [Bacilli bacterium]|nr:RIP metalloprotease RseP [Bacilli bacterium]
MTLIYFILILGITVMIHELGHFIFAKKAGIYVYEFSIGMGPKLFQIHSKKDETVYSIRLFPIGGYVQMAGESVEEDKNIPKEKQLQSKTWFQRFMTIIAGVLFNFLLAVVLFFIIGLVNGSPSKETYINTVEETSPAFQAGLEPNSQILELNGKKIKSMSQLDLELNINLGKNFEFVILTETGDTKTVTITPIEKETEETGKTYYYGFSYRNNYNKGILSALKYAFTNVFSLIHQMILVIFYLITGKLSLNNLSGPVGIYNIVGEASKYGILTMMNLIGLLCVNVGFINILPLPAFDGGRLLFLIIEKIKGKPVDSKIENTIHAIGMILLMGLMVVITYNDIMRLF